ncbi:MAG: SO_0444 family Cu/Zn efflux transporter [Proteobacteria bacterium]|nr:SO_0444 family Cu/Zn efflux transporter [Pseudomonadota bacterium]
MALIIEILSASWQIFYQSAPYMLFGFFVAGICYVFIRPEKIGRYLGQGKIRPVLLSALAGIPIPLCSCGVVPAAADLKRRGANNGATLAFLISTPETGMDSIPITYALMDPVMTVMRPVAAFFTAIVAGITENFFNKSNPESNTALQGAGSDAGGCSCNTSTPNPSNALKTSLWAKIESGLKYAFVDLLGDIGPWFVVGILLAGLIACFMPETLFESYLNNKFTAMLVMLLAGLPMYVCATSSTPIAAALVLKGLNPGAALVFLLAGPATNIASLSMVSGLLGRRSLLIYLGSIAVCTLFFGVLTDMLYYGFGINAKASAGQTAEILPHYVELAAAFLLAFLLAFSIWKRHNNRDVVGICSPNPMAL